MEEVEYTAHGTGVHEEITSTVTSEARARLEAAVARGQAAQRHVWILISTHLLDDQTARKLVGNDAGDVVFNASTLAGTDFGCYICETVLSPDLIGKRCPGSPEDGN